MRYESRKGKVRRNMERPLANPDCSSCKRKVATVHCEGWLINLYSVFVFHCETISYGYISCDIFILVVSQLLLSYDYLLFMYQLLSYLPFTIYTVRSICVKLYRDNLCLCCSHCKNRNASRSCAAHTGLSLGEEYATNTGHHHYYYHSGTDFDDHPRVHRHPRPYPHWVADAGRHWGACRKL